MTTDSTNPRLILASASPRRKELLALLGIPFEISVSHADETIQDSSQPEKVASDLALKKALEVSARFSSDHLILGCDTIVISPNGEILGKPEDREDARRMLELLSGQTHRVATGVALVEGRTGRPLETFTETARVTMGELDPILLQAYLDTEESMDKAGAYGIQAHGALLIKKIEGDYFTVVGLPVYRVASTLRRLGYGLLQSDLTRPL